LSKEFIPKTKNITTDKEDDQVNNKNDHNIILFR